MTKSLLLSLALLLGISHLQAQTAMPFSGNSCNGDPVNLFADLDAGKAVLLHFFMPNCGTCPPPAQRIQKMANKINAVFPGKVIGYAFPFENSSSCIVSSNWVATANVAALYTPMDSGEAQVAYYGGFGMPTVVLLGGMDHRVLFSTQSFSSSDTTIMRDSILALLNTANGIQDLHDEVNSFNVYPNPANDILTIEFKNQIPSTQLCITNTLGQVILSSDINNANTATIDIAHLPAGIYFVQIRAGTEVLRHKFIKQ